MKIILKQKKDSEEDPRIAAMNDIEEAIRNNSMDHEMEIFGNIKKRRGEIKKDNEDEGEGKEQKGIEHIIDAVGDIQEDMGQEMEPSSERIIADKKKDGDEEVDEELEDNGEMPIGIQVIKKKYKVMK